MWIKREVIVRFVDIGGIDDHHCLICFFHNSNNCHYHIVIFFYCSKSSLWQESIFMVWFICSWKWIFKFSSNPFFFCFKELWLVKWNCAFVIFPFVQRINLRIKQYVPSLPSVICRRAHVLFKLFVFVCLSWYRTHIVLCFCFVFLCHVYTVLSVSLDCPFFIVPSIFSNVYFNDHLDKLHDL